MNMFYQLTLIAVLFVTILIYVMYLLLNRENGSLSEYQNSSNYQFVQLTNGLTAYREFGSKNNTPIIVIHGGTLPSEGYLEFCQRLSELNYWVICYDQFGRGYSDRPKIKYSMDIYQLQLDELLNHLKIDKFILYGVSMGAPIAVQYSNNHIDRSLAVGIQVPVVHIDNYIFKILNIPIVGEIMMRFFGLPLIKKRAFEWNNDEFVNEDFIEKYINQLTLPGTEYALLSASRNLFPKDYTYIYEVFSKTKIPFHIAYANDDTEVSSDLVRAIIKINNNTDVFMFTGGHGGSAKIPDKIVNVFESFLSKNLNQ